MFCLNYRYVLNQRLLLEQELEARAAVDERDLVQVLLRVGEPCIFTVPFVDEQIEGALDDVPVEVVADQDVREDHEYEHEKLSIEVFQEETNYVEKDLAQDPHEREDFPLKALQFLARDAVQNDLGEVLQAGEARAEQEAAAVLDDDIGVQRDAESEGHHQAAEVGHVLGASADELLEDAAEEHAEEDHAGHGAAFEDRVEAEVGEERVVVDFGHEEVLAGVERAAGELRVLYLTNVQ